MKFKWAGLGPCGAGTGVPFLWASSALLTECWRHKLPHIVLALNSGDARTFITSQYLSPRTMSRKRSFVMFPMWYLAYLSANIIPQGAIRPDPLICRRNGAP